MASRTSRIFAALGLSMVLSLSLAAEADAARRGGGSFGSRGARTYQAPPPTKTAPGQVQPIQRSMTSPQQAPAAANRPMAGAPAAAAARRPGFFGNPLVRGLMLGGLIGLLLGHGFGGAAGMLGMILQIALVAIAAMLLFKLFARRRAAAPAAAYESQGAFRSPFDVQQPASGGYTPAYQPAVDRGADFAVAPSDRDDFERLLREIQEAYGREDYAAIRERTTPEIMGYLAEELGQNATQGLRNEVTNVRMLEGDVAEAWREGDVDYATAALRYAAHDVMRSRDTGAVVEGDPAEDVETTELWTFTRRRGEPWKLSAIQQAH